MKRFAKETTAFLSDLNIYSKIALNITALLSLLLMLVSIAFLVYAPRGEAFYQCVYYFEKVMECSRAVFVAGLMSSLICELIYRDKRK